MTLTEIFIQKYPTTNFITDNFKKRHTNPNGIIIHSMGEFIEGYGHAPEFLDEVGLSAHTLINPDGSKIHMVDPKYIAYHAGKSKFQGQTNLNSTFIGIELLVEGTHTYSSFLKAIKKSNTFTQYHYDSTAVQCALLMDNYQDITLDRIVSHSEVSGKDVRPDPKYDVGSGFSMSLLKDMIKEFHRQLQDCK